MQRLIKLQKKFKKNSNNESEKLFTQPEIILVKDKIATYKYIIESLAWTLIRGDVAIAKRFYTKDKSTKILSQSNLEFSIESANIYNKDPLKFALITDLTKYFQIGDLLIKDKDKIGIVECKDGFVNSFLHYQLFERKGFLGVSTEEIVSDYESLKGSLSSEDKTGLVKQVIRMMRQYIRMDRLRVILNTDTGENPSEDPENKNPEKVELISPNHEIERYNFKLLKLEENLDYETLGIANIEDILYLVSFYPHHTNHAEILLKLKMQERKSTLYHIFELNNKKYQIAEPLFAKIFSPDFIINILTNRVKIKICIDYKNFIKAINDSDIRAELMTEKKTKKYLKGQNMHKSPYVIINNRILKIVNLNNKKELFFAKGLLSKMIYDNIKPSSIIKMALDGIKKLFYSSFYD